MAGRFVHQADWAVVHGGGREGGTVDGAVHINANGKARTVEELHTQKKDMHVAASCYLLAETASDFARIAEGECPEDCLASY